MRLEKIGRQNALQCLAVDRFPGSARRIGHEQSGGEHGRRASHGPTVLGVEEPGLLQGGQEPRQIVLPIPAAVIGEEDNAGAGVTVGMRISAHRPAGLAIDEVDRFERVAGARCLQPPLVSAVFGMPDSPAITDGPPVLGVDEADVGQTAVGTHHMGPHWVFRDLARCAGRHARLGVCRRRNNRCY